MRSGITATFLALAIAACADVAAPRSEVEYALESIDGKPLPMVLLTDYDIVVSVVSDVVILRDDSTFAEVATFHGASDDRELLVADTITGTYSIAGTTLYLLLPGGRASQMRVGGDSLTQHFGRLLVYRRR